ncbi:hypothetical protein [Candidatus Enterococcus mansonii]|uniref:Yip1 domain-containing protein n=1 Tax=Candidatus Enterococcus mansonii TaxID=1834181 RepID=A0A242CG41_9ENTE|nr:hypothetical protein [Enterococcus sp. 4G2_DIV0659]OTO08890.1 hypothetical protein A5880_001890 [Enterococcus sp. 4G2_DIV0659]
MSRKLKNLGLKFIMVSVYVMSYILLMFDLARNNPEINTFLSNVKERLNITETSSLFVVAIIIIPFILVMLFVTYFLIKTLFQLLYKGGGGAYSDQIFVSLLLTRIVVNTLSLLLINVVSVSLVSGVALLLDFILFLYLFYSSSKNLRATKILALVKVILLIISYVVGIVFS